MTTVKTSNYSAAQIAALQAHKGSFNNDVANTFAKMELFAGKNARSIISKVLNLGLPYEKAGTKAPSGVKKDETAMNIADDIKSLLGLSESVVLTQKTGLAAIREGIRSIIAQRDEALENEEVQEV